MISFSYFLYAYIDTVKVELGRYRVDDLQLPRLVLIVALEVLLGIDGLGALVEDTAGGDDITDLAIGCNWSLYFFHNVNKYIFLFIR